MPDPRGHFCPECATWWECGGDPCGTPLIEPCVALNCYADWREALDADHQPFPEWYAASRNLYPWRDYAHPDYYSGVDLDHFFMFQVYKAFNIHRMLRL